MKIVGSWDAGYVLDWHVLSSVLDGENSDGKPKFNTIRTDVGEAVYQLKYRSDFTKAHLLALSIATQIVPLFSGISYIIPMPPSKIRSRQPVPEIAREIGRLIKKDCLENLLIKNGTTLQMKDIPTIEEKNAALLGCFALNDSIVPNGKYNLLIIDDLYSSGASLNAATTTLRKSSKIQNI